MQVDNEKIVTENMMLVHVIERDLGRRLTDEEIESFATMLVANGWEHHQELLNGYNLQQQILLETIRDGVLNFERSLGLVIEGDDNGNSSSQS